MRAWEIATLVSRNRLRLSLTAEAWFEALLGFCGGEARPDASQGADGVRRPAGGAAEGSGRSNHRGYQPNLRIRGGHPRRRTDALRACRAHRSGRVLEGREVDRLEREDRELCDIASGAAA